MHSPGSFLMESSKLLLLLFLLDTSSTTTIFWIKKTWLTSQEEFNIKWRQGFRTYVNSYKNGAKIKQSPNVTILKNL